jgi:hypothetical protein
MKYRLTSVLLAFATFGITALPMVTHAPFRWLFHFRLAAPAMLWRAS